MANLSLLQNKCYFDLLHLLFLYEYFLIYVDILNYSTKRLEIINFIPFSFILTLESEKDGNRENVERINTEVI